MKVQLSEAYIQRCCENKKAAITQAAFPNKDDV